MKYTLILIFLSIIASNTLDAQKLNLKDKHYCNAHHSDEEKESVYLLEPSESAKRLLDTISQATGLDKESVILKGADVEVALAVLDGKKRYILINELAIIDSESDIDNRYQLYFLIAHELAHHALGHTLDEEGSRHEYELKADEFAGFAMAKLGANLEQTLSVTEDFEEDETDTHPPQSIRKQQITIGWKNGKEGIKPTRQDNTIHELETEEDNFRGCANQGRVSVKNHTSETYYVMIEATSAQSNPDKPNTWGKRAKREVIVRPNQEATLGIVGLGNYNYLISVQTSYGRNQIPHKTGVLTAESCKHTTINID